MVRKGGKNNKLRALASIANVPADKRREFYEAIAAYSRRPRILEARPTVPAHCIAVVRPFVADEPEDAPVPEEGRRRTQRAARPNAAAANNQPVETIEID